MVATGAQVRLFRRGVARPIGVRWAAAIACAGSVQAVAKRQRCLRHRWIKSRQRRESAHPNNTAGGHTPPQGGTGTQGQNPPQGGGSKRPPQGGTPPQGGGGPGGHNTAGGTSTQGGRPHPPTTSIIDLLVLYVECMLSNIYM